MILFCMEHLKFKVFNVTSYFFFKFLSLSADSVKLDWKTIWYSWTNVIQRDISVKKRRVPVDEKSFSMSLNE